MVKFIRPKNMTASQTAKWEKLVAKALVAESKYKELEKQMDKVEQEREKKIEAISDKYDRLEERLQDRLDAADDKTDEASDAVEEFEDELSGWKDTRLALLEKLAKKK